jgi:O-antigen/teichoic acid export membrane protein
MNKIKDYIVNHPYYNKAKYWGKLISITGSAQIVVQAVGFLSGILVIRLLAVEEYALYTLANTMLGTMTILSDGGISTGVMAEGGKVWQDRKKSGVVLTTGLDLRRKFAIVSLIISIPVLGYLLLHNGANWITTVLITASLIPAFYAALSDGLLQIPVKLHQAIPPLQKIR